MKNIWNVVWNTKVNIKKNCVEINTRENVVFVNKNILKWKRHSIIIQQYVNGVSKIEN